MEYERANNQINQNWGLHLQSPHPHSIQLSNASKENNNFDTQMDNNSDENTKENIKQFKKLKKLKKNTTIPKFKGRFRLHTKEAL
jgi:hypothetical protein